MPKLRKIPLTLTGVEIPEIPQEKYDLIEQQLNESGIPIRLTSHARDAMNIAISLYIRVADSYALKDDPSGREFSLQQLSKRVGEMRNAIESLTAENGLDSQDHLSEVSPTRLVRLLQTFSPQLESFANGLQTFLGDSNHPKPIIDKTSARTLLYVLVRRICKNQNLPYKVDKSDRGDSPSPFVHFMRAVNEQLIPEDYKLEIHSDVAFSQQISRATESSEALTTEQIFEKLFEFGGRGLETEGVDVVKAIARLIIANLGSEKIIPDQFADDPKNYIAEKLNMKLDV